VATDIVVSPAVDTIRVTGGTTHFSAQVLDQRGSPMSGAPITWSIQPSDVAGIDGSGLATALGAGVAQVRASSEGASGGATLAVVLTPVAASKAAGDEQTGVVGKALPTQPQVLVLDGSGTPIQGAWVQFQVLEGGGSVFPPSAPSGPDGIAAAIWTLGPAPGEDHRLRATVGDLSVDFRATATWPPLTILTERPPSARLTLTYSEALEATGGPGAPYSWAVVGAGLPPGMELLPTGSVAGTPTAEGDFVFTAQVTDGEGTTANGEVSLRVCPAPTPLAPGESLFADPSGLDGCGFFIPTGAAGDRYRVGIVRSETNRDADDVVTATLDVRGLGVEALPPPLELAPGAVEVIPPEVAARLREDLAIAEATEALQRSIWEEERALLPTLRDASPLPSFPAGSPAVAAARAAGAPPRLLLKFYNYQGCTAVEPKPALLLGENDHVAVYQDSAQSNSEPVSPGAVQAMLNYYEAYGKTVIDAYFGGTSDVNGDGIILVYVTPGIRETAAAFVRGFDMLPVSECPSSNAMEITYTKPSFVNRYEEGGYQVLGTVVHEIKHISSLYKRLQAGSYHPTWIEEGTAEIATDRASRLAMAANGGPAVGAMLTNADIVEWGPQPWGYNTMLRLSRSLRYIASQPNSVTVNPEGAEWVGPGGPQQRHTVYGSGWHFHRWLGDAYGNAATALADSALFRLQNDSLTVSGPDAYPDLVGRTFSELMEEYAVAVMLNGTGAPVPALGFTSVDFPSAMSSSWVYSIQTRPLGLYPWPVTWNDEGPGSVTMETAFYQGPIGESGLRVHDFVSNGTGQGAEITVEVPAQARVVLVRVR
jgi:hypothetical protein